MPLVLLTVLGRTEREVGSRVITALASELRARWFDFRLAQKKEGRAARERRWPREKLGLTPQ